jgi:hypothetical protein
MLKTKKEKKLTATATQHVGQEAPRTRRKKQKWSGLLLF